MRRGLLPLFSFILVLWPIMLIGMYDAIATTENNNEGSNIYKNILFQSNTISNDPIFISANSEFQQHSSLTKISVSNLIPVAPIAIGSDLDLSSEAITGSGSVNDPYIIEGYNITSSNFQHGISVSGTSQYFVIRGNYIDTGGLSVVNGIHISGVANGTALILNNTIENNDRGIIIQSSTFIHIANNSILNNLQYGIEIRDGSNNAHIEGNLIIQTSGEGIRLESANSIVKNNYIVGDPSEARFNIAIGVHRNNAMIINNTISDCTRGIDISPVSNALISNNYINGCWSGMGGWPSNSEISNNTLLNGRFGDSGITLQGQIGVEDSNNNEIKWNLIMNYPGYGINIFGEGARNIIQYNVFINNNINLLGSSQAFDNGANNNFLQNYWDEWITPDSDSDGIVDNPYQINGNSDNQDPFPLSYNILEINSLLAELHISTTDRNVLSNISPFEIIDKRIMLPILYFITLTAIVIPARQIIIRLPRISKNRLVKNTVNKILGYSSPLLFAIINSGDGVSGEITEPVPPELVKYKYLLNPVRLAIIKILYDYYSYPASMIREMINISWGQFSPHISSLIQKGYISAKEEFYQGSRTRIVRLESKGTSHYLELRRILKRLFAIH